MYVTVKQLKFSTPTSFMPIKSPLSTKHFLHIVGLHDTGNFKIGDTLTEGDKLQFKGIPTFHLICSVYREWRPHE
jgi:peptide chain release factor 3